MAAQEAAAKRAEEEAELNRNLAQLDKEQAERAAFFSDVMADCDKKITDRLTAQMEAEMDAAAEEARERVRQKYADMHAAEWNDNAKTAALREMAAKII